MKYDLAKSKKIYEVRYRDTNTGTYAIEELYKRYDGIYFMHFIGSKNSKYGIQIGYDKYRARKGNYPMNDYQISNWKITSIMLKKKYPKDYEIIDWEQEEDETFVFDNLFGFGGELKEEELPF